MKSHFIHKQINSINGYQKFLSNLEYGKYYQFNFQFFFYSNFWLVRQKLYFFTYFLFSFYIFLFGYFYNQELSPQENIQPILNVLALFHFFISFFINYILYIHLDNKFYKLNYDYKNCLKVSNPYPWYINLFINILIPISVIILLIVFSKTLEYLHLI